MPKLKPAYLIHGDDHGAIAERRARLRTLVEAEQGGAANVELLEGDEATPQRLAQALATMTLAIAASGEPEATRRVILVDGVERWRASDVEKHLKGAIGSTEPGTTVALFAREDSRAKAPPALHNVVKSAGGQIVAQATVKPWELPRWVREQAAVMGLELDAVAASALLGGVGERQQRLLRELEKLALELDCAPGSSTPLTAEEIESRAARSPAVRAYALGDSVVAGDGRRAVLTYLGLREQGEQLSGLVYLVAQRLREALAVSLRLQAGEPAAEVRKELRMPPRAAQRFIADVADADPDRLRRALTALAQLELDSRGGAPVVSSRSALAALSEDTLALRTIGHMAGSNESE